MDKKLDKFAEIGLDDLATVTGGRSGTGVAQEIKNKHDKDEMKKGQKQHKHDKDND